MPCPSNLLTDVQVVSKQVNSKNQPIGCANIFFGTQYTTCFLFFLRTIPFNAVSMVMITTKLEKITNWLTESRLQPQFWTLLNQCVENRPPTLHQATADSRSREALVADSATCYGSHSGLTLSWRILAEAVEAGARFRISDMIKYDQIWSFFCSCWLEQKDLNYLTDFYRLLKILFGGLNYTSSCWLEVSIIGTGANFRNHLSHERYHFPIPLILVGS